MTDHRYRYQGVETTARGNPSSKLAREAFQKTCSASKKLQVGDQYRSVGSAFRNAAWVLTEIFTSADGIDHARLTSTHDMTESRTLALSVIADTRRFTPTELTDKSTG